MQRSHIGPIAIFANYAISPTPDGRHLLVADARVVDGTTGDSTTGIGVLDMATRDPVAFIPLATGAMTPMPPGPAYPDGAVIVAGSEHGKTLPSVDQLFVLDGATLAIRDSVTFPFYSGWFTQVLAAPDRVHVYAVTATELYEYDLVARQVVTTGPRLGTGQLAIAPDGQRLYLSDRGNYAFPGSGRIFVYDAALQPLPSFDLLAPVDGFGGAVPVTDGLTTSPDGRRLYVISGSVEFVQHGRLFVLDANTGSILSTFALQEYGVHGIFLR